MKTADGYTLMMKGAVKMYDDFIKDGRILIRFETPEERQEIIRVLEEQHGFQIDGKLKEPEWADPWNTGSFAADFRSGTCEYVRPMIGAAMVSSGWRVCPAQELLG